MKLDLGNLPKLFEQLDAIETETSELEAFGKSLADEIASAQGLIDPRDDGRIGTLDAKNSQERICRARLQKLRQIREDLLLQLKEQMPEATYACCAVFSKEKKAAVDSVVADISKHFPERIQSEVRALAGKCTAISEINTAESNLMFGINSPSLMTDEQLCLAAGKIVHFAQHLAEKKTVVGFRY